MPGEVRTFTAEVTDLARELRTLAEHRAGELIAVGVTDAAKIAATTVRRAGLRDSSLLTRRLITSSAVEVSAARKAGAGAWYATATVGGRTAVNASGRPLAGQVIFGSEFGGQRRTYAATGAGRTKLRGGTYAQLRRRRGLSVGEQAAIYRAGGVATRRTTAQFRPYRAGGYWLFSGLSAADRALVTAMLAPLDKITAEVARG